MPYAVFKPASQALNHLRELAVRFMFFYTLQLDAHPVYDCDAKKYLLLFDMCHCSLNAVCFWMR
jgi:hypothetical protein